MQRLIVTNTYFVGSPSQATVTVQDTDPLSANVVVAAINGPSGIDYHPVNTSLIISRNDTSGTEKNFKRLASNGFVSDWSTASGLGFTNPNGNAGELKVGIVQTTADNWTQGDLYFGPGQPGKIGKITANASSVNTDWATLTNSTQMVGETDPFMGGFYIDQTGVFGGDLIALSGGAGVWRVTAATNATKVAQINDASGNGIGLEGVVTVPNDPSKYGPWAGNILTCAESAGLIYAVDVNGNATAYNLGLGVPEDVRLIASGQNLYCLDFTHNQVLKVTQDNFAGFAGDVLLVDESGGCAVGGLYVVHWTGGGFVVRQIPVGTSLEHVTFAPIDIPALP